MINEFATNKIYADIVEQAYEMQHMLIIKQLNAKKQTTIDDYLMHI